MTSSPQSIDKALRDRNPFAKPPYLNAKDIWGQDFFDVESVNAHASDAVFQALKQIRDGLYSTTSIAITAQDGTGKTHIISRIAINSKVIRADFLFMLINIAVSAILSIAFNRY